MNDTPENKLRVLSDLVDTINQRATESSSTSYTARLLSAGREKCAGKFGEESFELALAAMGDDRGHIIAEAGDVIYHLLVLLRSTNVSFNDVLDELDRRTAQSGLEEKASRDTK